MNKKIKHTNLMNKLIKNGIFNSSILIIFKYFNDILVKFYLSYLRYNFNYML